MGIPIDALSRILSFEQFKDLVRTEDLSALTSPILSEIAQSITNAANDLLGIICLTEVRDSLLMWGHYTDAHKGLIFGFDPSHPFFDQRVREDDVIRSLRKVSYSKHRPRVTLYDSTLGDAELADSFANQFFLTKFQDWSYEKEWRMILPLEQSTLVDGAHLLALPEGCLTEVVLGNRISDTDRETIETCLDADGFWTNVTLSEASIDKEEFRINIDGRVH